MNEIKKPVGILGATGTVGQRFIELLNDHPWFEIKVLAASRRSANKSYSQALEGRNNLQKEIDAKIMEMEVLSVEDDMDKICEEMDFVFCALDMDKEKIKEIELNYASRNCPVVSNNSAHRWTEDIPMFMPEINPHHCEIINIQKEKRGFDKGFIAVKPNCSIQSYVPLIQALMKFSPEKVIVSTYQAISGAGKTFETWPDIIDNVIPYIGGEEDKSEKEPLKIWGEIENGIIKNNDRIHISANCLRVPVSDGHLATVNISFKDDISEKDILNAWKNFDNPIANLALPSAPNPFITYFEENDRPQTKLDRDNGNGMGITAGRLRKDNILDYKFVALSHNTIRGAAGGALLTAELLKAKGFI